MKSSNIILVNVAMIYGACVIPTCRGLAFSADEISKKRRFMLQGTGTFLTTSLLGSKPAFAVTNSKSRTEGYAVQRTEREWAYVLSGAQYNILRRGGTERQKSSILNTFTSESNIGTYSCAGCGTPLFSSKDKFSSNTGWPSFSAALPSVEEQELDPIRATLDGREARCGTCGGHLGDVFNDGWVYIGSSAANTGKRYCIDGAALIFKAEDGSEVFGDLPPPSKSIQYAPSMYRNTNTG